MNRWISTCGLILTTALAAGMLGAQETKKDPSSQAKRFKAPVKQAVDAARTGRTVRPKRADARDARRPSLPSTGSNRPQRPDMSRDVLRRRQTMVLEGQLARMRQDYLKYSGELRAIRKIALEENAGKTVEYIDKLIARRKQDFETAAKRINDKIKEINARAGKQVGAGTDKLQKTRRPRPMPPKPKVTETKKTPDKKVK